MRLLHTIILLLALVRSSAADCQENNQQNQGDLKGFDSLAALGESILSRLTFESAQGIWTVYPAGGYSQRTGLEFGLMPVYSWKNLKRETPVGTVNTLSSSLQFSTKGMVELRSELDWYHSPDWQLSVKLEALRIHDQYWDAWSLPQSNTANNYEAKRLGLKMQVLRHAGHRIYTGLHTQVRHHQFKPEDADASFGGHTGSSGDWLTGAGPVIVMDRRDHVLYPRRGSYMQASWTLFTHEKGNVYQNYLMDFRHFIDAGKPVVALQGLWEYASGNLPFYGLPLLGGKDRLRGIGHSKRVVDQAVWLLRGELRMPLWWRFGAVAFVETGQASARPSFDWNELIFSQGGGLRFRILPKEPLHIRVDVAWSSAGTQGLFISLKEAF